MRIAVVSDTHGNNKGIIEKLSEIEKPDILFHLGDYVTDGVAISKALGFETIIVRGNGDHLHTEYNEDELVEIKGKKIFLTHGHKYNVQNGIVNLYYKGLELGSDIVLFGHIHVPIIEKIENMIIMNPGSPSLPRNATKIKTFGIINIGNTIETKIIEIN
ncbi:YfcE family phosphodiesterase [Tissierella sp. P1]|uniref:metallophosphoesterase n=1 Tax=unclassified Tissierella TaxID=2638726 RepID=UPI000B9FCF93|nr:metallophosphoesterase [Tissierella sp. P1]OZV13660.1 YfcE family phosphodiesterase [Tissierella sp. P1]